MSIASTGHEHRVPLHQPLNIFFLLNSPFVLRETAMPKLVPNTQTGSLTDNQHGTNDTLFVVVDGITFPGQPGNLLYGDAASMLDDSRGGNDTLIGADGPLFYNIIVGDAGTMSDSARGGNDTVIGGNDTTNNLYGDAVSMYDDARGGNDTVIG